MGKWVLYAQPNYAQPKPTHLPPLDAVFESDALEVINAVQGIATPSSSTQFIVDGIHRRAYMFRSCYFTHTKR